MKFSTRFAALALLVAVGPANAALHHLDPSFSTDGRYNAGNAGSQLRLLAHLQRPDGTSVAVAFYDGSICPAGRYCLALYPFNSAGVMTGALFVPTNTDATFSKRQGGGIVLDDVMIKAADIDSQGRIVVVGSEQLDSKIDFKIVRLLPNGLPDNTFGGTGVETIDFHGGGANQDFANAVSVDPYDKIVVVGEVQRSATDTDFGIARLNVDGSLDNLFMGTGKRTIPFDLSPSNSDQAVAVKASSTTIYIAGNASDNGVGRLAFVQLLSTGDYRTAFCPGACNYQGSYPGINSGRRVISYGYESDTSDFLVSASVNMNTRKWVYAGARLGPPPTYTSEMFVQTLDTNGEYVNEGLRDGAFSAPYRVGGVRWVDENNAASNIVLTGVSADLLFFAQGMDSDLYPIVGWGGAGDAGSYFFYDEGYIPGNLPTQPSVDSAGRLLVGGSSRDDNLGPYSIHVARIAQDDTIFKNGFQ